MVQYPTWDSTLQRRQVMPHRFFYCETTLCIMTTTNTMALSDQQIDVYDENGYLIIRNILSPNEAVGLVVSFNDKSNTIHTLRR